MSLDDPFVTSDQSDPILLKGEGRSAPPSGLWLLYLYFRPRRFFAHFHHFVTKFSVCYVALLVGMAAAIDRISTKLMQEDMTGRERLPDVLTDSWAVYWIACLVSGVFGAVLYYGIGGWWYRVRLNWSGDSAPDKKLARQVYIFASVVYSLPMVILQLLDTLRYPTPIEAENAAAIVGPAIMVFTLLLSIYTSYRGVRSLFDVAVWKARFWFLLAPAGCYMVVLGGAAIFGFFLIAGKPVLTNPIKHDRPVFSLYYPNNWMIDDTDEDYDPDAEFSIEPIFDDAYMVFRIADWATDAIETTSDNLESYQSIFVGTPVTSFDQWGRYAGAGAEYFGDYEGSRYKLRIFTTTTNNQHVVIVEIAEESTIKKMEPGFDLIRRSFRFKE